MARKLLGHIPDGYTDTAYVEGEDGLYPPCRFRYRPSTYEERADYFETTGQFKGRDKARRVISWLRKRVERFDLCAQAGEPSTEPKPDLARLEASLIDRMVSMVLRITPSDPDPLDLARDSDEEADRKNSSTGCS